MHTAPLSLIQGSERGNALGHGIVRRKRKGKLISISFATIEISTTIIPQCERGREGGEEEEEAPSSLYRVFNVMRCWGYTIGGKNRENFMNERLDKRGLPLFGGSHGLGHSRLSPRERSEVGLDHGLVTNYQSATVTQWGHWAPFFSR